MKQITIIVQRDSGEIHLDVPEPKEGKWAPSVDPKNPAPRPTAEQRAHFEFWTDGTTERVAELVKGNDGITVRDTLVWLVSLRVKVVQEKTGFIYQIVVREEPPTSVRARTVV